MGGRWPANGLWQQRKRQDEEMITLLKSPPLALHGRHTRDLPKHPKPHTTPSIVPSKRLTITRGPKAEAGSCHSQASCSTPTGTSTTSPPCPRPWAPNCCSPWTRQSCGRSSRGDSPWDPSRCCPPGKTFQVGNLETHRTSFLNSLPPNPVRSSALRCFKFHTRVRQNSNC